MGWTRAEIRQKIRNLVGGPDEDQFTDADLNTRIENYYVFTMPFELKEQIENQYLQFKTVPGQNVYSFPGAYFTDSPGAYADGFPLIFYQDPDVFFQDWPQQYAVDNLATGDGATVDFSGGLQNPPIIIGSLFITDGVQVLQDSGTPDMTQVLAVGSGIVSYNGTINAFPIVPGSFSATDTIETFSDNNDGTLIGNLGGSGTINYSTGAWALTFNTAVTTGVNIIGSYTLSSVGIGTLTGNGSGSINYTTGAYSFTFNAAPAADATIYAKYLGYSGNRPQGVLFWNNQFTLMPVPDQVYQILMQGFIKPATLSTDSSTPLQEEWGPLIAYGVALDIFADVGDLGNYDRYYPIFKRYENVALGRTIQQYTPMQSVPRF